MSGVLTPAMSNVLLQLFFNRGTYTPPFTDVQIALTRRVPVNNAGLNQLDEPVGGGYRRSNPVLLSNSVWSLNGSGQMFNSAPISWPLDCTVPWGTISGWAMISRGASPAVLAVGEINTPYRFVPPMRPRLPVGAITFGPFDA